jgi:MIP family channel proteins
MSPARAMYAESIGTFALTFVGGAAIIVTAGSDMSLLAVALAHGLILGVMVSAAMHISGGQFNPAVAIAIAAIGRQSWLRCAMFIAAQLAGAVAAALLLKVTFAPLAEFGLQNLGATLGSYTTGEDLHIGAALALEVVATFFLMFVIMGVGVDRRGAGPTTSMGGFAIGMTIAANILAIGPLTGASMNPARSFGPALIASAWDAHWLYWIAPIVGALLAAVTYRAVFEPPDA